jgi:hypothetical protein
MPSAPPNSEPVSSSAEPVPARSGPALAAAIQDGAFSATDDVEFEFGLERVLDGIEVLVERRAAMP